MPRPIRIDFPGAFHHVMHRGARRAPIFTDAADCQLLLDTLDDAASRFGVEVHAFSLIPNHYHLLLRSVRGDLSRVMKFVNGNYTTRLNRKHSWDGPVFRGRFHSRLVESPRHLRYLLPYIHLNPVRAQLVARPEAECWTSHRAYLELDRRPAWLSTRYFLRLLGGRSGLKDLVTGLHQGRVPWPPDLDLESGWFTGDDEAEPSPAPRERPRAAPARSTDVDGFLARVSTLTGASLEELRKAEHGPGANPARRFAVWALIRRGALGHGEAGRALSMTTGAVSKVSSRLGLHAQSEQMRAWIKAWDEEGRS